MRAIRNSVGRCEAAVIAAFGQSGSSTSPDPSFNRTRPLLHSLQPVTIERC